MVPQPVAKVPKKAYVPPQPAYVPPKPAYVPPAPAYVPPEPAYVPPKPAYVPPAPAYVPPAPAYVPPAPAYVPPEPAYVPPAPAYVPPAPAVVEQPVVQAPVVQPPAPVVPAAADVPKPAVRAPAVAPKPVVPAVTPAAAEVPKAVLKAPAVADQTKPVQPRVAARANDPKPEVATAVVPQIQVPNLMVPKVAPDFTFPFRTNIANPTLPNFQLAGVPDIQIPKLPSFNLPTVFSGPVVGPVTDNHRFEKKSTSRSNDVVFTGKWQWVNNCWNGTTITLTNACLRAVVAHASMFDGCNYNFWLENVGWIHTSGFACSAPPAYVRGTHPVIWDGCGCEQYTFVSPSGLWCTGYYRDDVLIYTGQYPLWVRNADQARQAQDAGQVNMNPPTFQTVVNDTAIVTDVPAVVQPLAPAAITPSVTDAVDAVSQALSPLILPVSHNRPDNWWQGPALALGIGLLVAAWFADRRKIELESKAPQQVPGGPTHIAGGFA